MQIEQMQLLVESGKLKEAIITPCPSGNGWMVECKDTNGHIVKLTTHGGEERLYKSLDTATKVTEKIGFHCARIEEKF